MKSNYIMINRLSKVRASKQLENAKTLPLDLCTTTRKSGACIKEILFMTKKEDTDCDSYNIGIRLER